MLVPLVPQIVVPRSVVVAAVQQLSTVDYTVANRVTEVAAVVVQWAYAHDCPALASWTVHSLQYFDNLGGLLITIAVWLADHAM